MSISFEVYHQNDAGIDEVQEFWLEKWNQNFQKLIGKSADPALFQNSDTYYILRFNGQIGAIMSSKRQLLGPDLKTDSYYQAWPNAIDHLQGKGVKEFHRMGMIAAETDLIPKGFKMTRILIGCGLKYNFANNPENQATVSFPRPDTSVYQACVDWGALPVQKDLVMFNAPVNFVVLEKFNLRTYHMNPEVDRQTQDLWAHLCANKVHRIKAGKPLPVGISCDSVRDYESAS